MRSFCDADPEVEKAAVERAAQRAAAAKKLVFAASSLDELCAALNTATGAALATQDLFALPRFGGPEVDRGIAAFSWDESRMLVMRTDPEDSFETFVIEPRPH